MPLPLYSRDSNACRNPLANKDKAKHFPARETVGRSYLPFSMEPQATPEGTMNMQEEHTSGSSSMHRRIQLRTPDGSAHTHPRTHRQQPCGAFAHTSPLTPEARKPQGENTSTGSASLSPQPSADLGEKEGFSPLATHKVTWSITRLSHR